MIPEKYRFYHILFLNIVSKLKHIFFNFCPSQKTGENMKRKILMPVLLLPLAIISLLIFSGLATATPLAPGYCISNGGDTSYEYISGVNYTKNPTGTMIITSEIFIENPTGCTFGNPCPEYDNSPEYVNNWVDWDGDETFETHERTIDDALTGYHDLNYYGTMTTSTIVTIPNGSANMTWMRTNLGWSHDPNDPCETSWTWGDVFDEQVSTETNLPQILNILVSGAPGDVNNPTTTKSVTLEAVIENVPGYTVTSVGWTGDGIPGGATGNPYTFTPAAGTHGNKYVQCTISYEKDSTGDTGEDSLSRNYKLFFVKDGDDDGDGDPNWFEYWASDGAVPRLGETVYNATMGGYGCFGCVGTRVDVTPSAAGQHYGSAIVLSTHFGTESFGGPSVTGIDCAAEVVAHEFYHKSVWQNWQSGGDWVGDTDSDDGLQCTDCDDNLPDWYENTVSYTWNNDTDTYDLEHNKYWVYKYYGDNEYMAMKTGSSTKGNPAKDWANPGKQTTPAYRFSMIPSAISSGPIQAKFTGSNSDYGYDPDSDGLYNYLTVEAEIKVTHEGLANVVAILKDPLGNPIDSTNEQMFFGVGYHNITFQFDGVKIYESGMDGNYKVFMQLNNEFDYPNELDNQTYFTSSYTNEQFQRQSAEFTSGFYEYTLDTDMDKYINYLVIEVELFANKPGTYTVEGWLKDEKGDVFVRTSNATYLNKGFGHIYLFFDGAAIRQHRVDGPYNLTYLKLSKDGEEIEKVMDAHKTNNYAYKQFQKGNAELIDSYESWPEDPNGNKYYDLLNIAVGVDVDVPGKYIVIGGLYDKYGNKIALESTEEYLDNGETWVILKFLGKDIYKNGVNGPYTLKYVSLLDSEGEGHLDHQTDAHNTSSYNYNLFKPLIMLMGGYKEKPVDTDNDGYYDNLTICADVFSSDGGNSVLAARIIDKNGKEVAWAKKSKYVEQNEADTICVDFDGRYLYANMVSGRFSVQDVYVYHTGDVFFPDYVTEGDKTDSYDYTDFEPAGAITGKVMRYDKSPIPNALVKIEGVDFDYTDSNGRYVLTILNGGNYHVEVDPPEGYSGASADVFVNIGEKVIKDFVLSYSEPCEVYDLNGNGIIELNEAVAAVVDYFDYKIDLQTTVSVIVCYFDTCKSNKDCSVNQYCQKPTGQCDGLGKCEAKPLMCIILYDPVCGCDGETYTNGCIAAMNGESIAYDGVCGKG